MPGISCNRLDPPIQGSLPLSLKTKKTKRCFSLHLSSLGAIDTKSKFWKSLWPIWYFASFLLFFFFFYCLSFHLNFSKREKVQPSGGSWTNYNHFRTLKSWTFPYPKFEIWNINQILHFHITALVSQGEGWPRVTKYDVGMILVGGWKSFCVTRHNMNHRGHLAAITHPFPPWTHGVCMTPTLFWQEGKPARALEALPA